MTEAEPLGGRYKIISQLGAGGFGQTFLAEDLHLPGYPICVVKQLKAQTKDPSSLAMARRLFDTEAKVLYQLGDHDQIPRLLAHFEDNEEFYLAQEFIEGEPLTHELVVGERWSQGQVIALLQDILQVLAFVHQQQVIHRDIKPPNLIRRQSDGKVVLIDFGAVKQVSTQTVNPEAGETNLTISIGTQGYMPNEQLAGTPRFSSDIYAVGMLGIQGLTGVHPKHLKEDLRTGEIKWREHAPTVSPELADILDQMVCYDFRDRYPSAVEALEALSNLPPAVLESVTSPQPLPEVRESSRLEAQPSPSGMEPTESIIEIPTDIWIQADPPVAIGTDDDGMDLTTSVPQQEPIQDSIRSDPTPTNSGLIWSQLIKPWSILAILAIVGATFLLAKIFFFPPVGRQTANRISVPAKSPISSPTRLSSPTATASPRRRQAAELLNEADRLRKTGQYQQALSLYDQAIALTPRMPKAYWGRCSTLNQLKKPAEAVVACNDALDLRPNYAEALWSKGNALDQQNLTLEALQLYERATRIKPDFAEAWVSYGVSLQKYGRSEEAIDALDKAIDLNRNSSEAWVTKGEALANLGRFEPAIAALDKAIQLQPDNPRAINLRKKTREQLGR
jgi:serine/threonine protein kinase